MGTKTGIRHPFRPHRLMRELIHLFLHIQSGSTMRTFIIALLLLFDLAGFSQPYQGQTTALIPSGGQSLVLPNYAIARQINLTTNGSVNMGGNSYAITYTALPSTGAVWSVYCDFSKLTAVANNVNVFGVYPLDSFPLVTQFYLNFWVANNASGTPTLYHQFASSLNDFSTYFAAARNATAIFNGAIYSNDSLVAKRERLSPSTPIGVGAVLTAGDTAGNAVWSSCVPAYVCGNGG